MGKRRTSSSRRVNQRSNRRSTRVKRGEGSRIKRNSRKKGSLRPKRTKRIRRRNKIQVGGSKSPLSEAEELAAVRAEINALQGELSTEELQQAASARPVPSAIAVAEPPAEGASDPYIKVELENQSESTGVIVEIKNIHGRQTDGGAIKLTARRAVEIDMREGDVMTITTSLFSARFMIERKNGEIQKYVVEDEQGTLRLTSDAHMVGFGTHNGVQLCSRGKDCRYPSGRRSHPAY